MIEDIVQLPGGDVVVLDSQSREVRRFEPSGRLVAKAGGAGEGPGEFAYPEAIDLLGDSLLLVLDGRGRLTTFDAGGSRLEHVDDVRLQLFGRDLCTLGDRIFIQAFHEGSGIHEVDRAGGILRSFHPISTEFAYDLGDEWNFVLVESAAAGYLACLEGADLILAVSEWLPDVTGYAPDGAERWKAAIPGYRLTVPVLTVDNAAGWDRGDGSDNVFGLIPLGRNHAIVQTIRFAADQPYTDIAPASYLIDVGFGAISRMEAVLPVLRDATPTAVLGSVFEPFPQVHVVPLTGS